MTYQIPTTPGALVTKDGKRTKGALSQLLDSYQGLGKERTGATIFLEDAIVMPPLYSGPNRNARRNLYATEIAAILDSQDEQAA